MENFKIVTIYDITTIVHIYVEWDRFTIKQQDYFLEQLYYSTQQIILTCHVQREVSSLSFCKPKESPNSLGFLVLL